LALHAIQQLVQVLLLQTFQQRHLRLNQFSLLQLFLQELSSQQLFSQPSSPALLRHHLRWLPLVQPSSRLSSPASALLAERRASNRRVQHAHELGRLVDQ
jgi:hypothetical protein